MEIYDREKEEIVKEIDRNEVAVKLLYGNFVGRAFCKYILARPIISKMNFKVYGGKKSIKKIPKFIKKNKINMNDYEEKKYDSFNDFFTREIKMETRPISNNKNDLISCSDALLTAYTIDSQLVFKVKNSSYTVNELLKNDELASEYEEGYCLVFRLTVRDYHHYCFIDNGTCGDTTCINGLLHTVHPIAGKKVKVYSENNREYTVLKTENFGDVVQIEVGALNVGKIVNLGKKKFLKGEEKGHFEFGGSTIILLFKKNTIVLDDDILSSSKLNIETRVKYGETIGKKSL